MEAADKTTAAVRVCAAVAEAIRSLGEVPSGHLYARLMSDMDLATSQRIIAALVGAGLVRQDDSHLLTWIG
jgi:hypothetical protein